MKVSVIQMLDDFGDAIGIYIWINGTAVFNVVEDEPEDMTFLRTLKDCLIVPELLKRAYNAGMSGETFVLETNKVNSDWEVLDD
ncbi:MAG: hypothetical protein LBC77_09440 [Spirochaetaceae bacterium]|jgi:hypothetical protein|nr:hypothetical protein [Spirochaetaceae bacterium]